MKKLIIILFTCFISNSVFAQDREKDIIDNKTYAIPFYSYLICKNKQDLDLIYENIETYKKVEKGKREEFKKVYEDSVIKEKSYLYNAKKELELRPNTDLKLHVEQAEKELPIILEKLKAKLALDLEDLDFRYKKTMGEFYNNIKKLKNSNAVLIDLITFYYEGDPLNCEEVINKVNTCRNSCKEESTECDDFIDCEPVYEKIVKIVDEGNN